MANEYPLTYAEARNLLWRHANSDPSDSSMLFRDALNQALERIYTTGIWKGMRSREDLTGYITDNVMTLPYGYKSVVGVACDDCPYQILTEEHEFIDQGPGVTDAGEGGRYIIDLGFNEVSGNDVRQYKFTFDTANFTTIEGIGVRQYVWVEDDADVVRPSNIGALKFAIMAINLEDCGNLAAAQQYWASCEQVLSEEKTNDLQGHKRVQPQNPWGFGQGKEHNIM